MHHGLPALLLGMLLPLAGLAESDPSSEPASAPASVAPTTQPAESQAAASAQASPDAAKEKADDPIICKSTAKAGTRVATKSCMRRSEWVAMTKKAEEDFAAIRNRPVHCPECRD